MLMKKTKEFILSENYIKYIFKYSQEIPLI
jgi:hypothetical protein